MDALAIIKASEIILILVVQAKVLLTNDYVLLCEKVFHCIANIYIDDRTESCHLPVVAIFYSKVECDNVKPPVKGSRDHVN